MSDTVQYKTVTNTYRRYNCAKFGNYMYNHISKRIICRFKKNVISPFVFIIFIVFIDGYF